MSDLESGKERVQKLCDLIKKETLDPAKQEAEKILSDAQEKREGILQAARMEAENILGEAKKKIEEEKRIFDSSLNLAGKQALNALKQEIEGKLFDQEIVRQVKSVSGEEKAIAKVIDAIVLAIEKEGINSDLEASIPSAVSKDEVVKALSDQAVEKLKKESIQLADFTGGAKVKIAQEHLTLDISDEALARLVSNFIREDLKAKLFA
ncbi:MAG: hypothetical protein SNF33_01560 [Candidatus Algichlamydia australiensis]|nr:hypothetical protein [Chlamydiales bacterium]